MIIKTWACEHQVAKNRKKTECKKIRKDRRSIKYGNKESGQEKKNVRRPVCAGSPGCRKYPTMRSYSVLWLTSIVLANKTIDLLGFLLIFFRMHFNAFIICLPLLGRSDKSTLLLYRFTAIQTVNLAIERTFAITESEFPARCSVIMVTPFVWHYLID